MAESILNKHYLDDNIHDHIVKFNKQMCYFTLYDHSVINGVPFVPLYQFGSNEGAIRP